MDVRSEMDSTLQAAYVLKRLASGAKIDFVLPLQISNTMSSREVSSCRGSEIILCWKVDVLFISERHLYLYGAYHCDTLVWVAYVLYRQRMLMC